MTDESAASPAPEPRDGGDVELLALIDRLAELLERSDLSELEVESGGTGLILRKPVLVAAAAPAAPVLRRPAPRRPPRRRRRPANRRPPGATRRRSAGHRSRRR